MSSYYCNVFTVALYVLLFEGPGSNHDRVVFGLGVRHVSLLSHGRRGLPDGLLKLLEKNSRPGNGRPIIIARSVHLSNYSGSGNNYGTPCNSNDRKRHKTWSNISGDAEMLQMRRTSLTNWKGGRVEFQNYVWTCCPLLLLNMGNQVEDYRVFTHWRAPRVWNIYDNLW